jgi:hypothetical protein
VKWVQYSVVNTVSLCWQWELELTTALVLNHGCQNFFCSVYVAVCVDLGGLVVSVLATGPKVSGFDPDRGGWIFKGDKNP